MKSIIKNTLKQAGLLIAMIAVGTLTATAGENDSPKQASKTYSTVEQLVEELSIPTSLHELEEQLIVFVEYRVDSSGQVEVLGSNGSNWELVDHVESCIDGVRVLSEQAASAGRQVMKISFKLL